MAPAPAKSFKSETIARFFDAAARFALDEPKAQSSWKSVPGAAEGEPPENMCHFVADEWVQRGDARRIVNGWCLERLDRQASGGLELIMTYHSLVELDDGRWVCPSTSEGSVIDFFEDLSRPCDLIQGRYYNQMLVSNRPMEVSVPGPDNKLLVGAFTRLWGVQMGDRFLLSTQERHSRWVAFGHQNPFAFATELGLNTRSALDLAFVSDLNKLVKAISALSRWNPLGASPKEQSVVLAGLELAVNEGRIQSATAAMNPSTRMSHRPR